MRPAKRIAILSNDQDEAAIVSFVLGQRARYRIEHFSRAEDVAAFIAGRQHEPESCNRVHLVIGVQCSYDKGVACFASALVGLRGAYPGTPTMLIDAGYGVAPQVDMPRHNGHRDLRTAMYLVTELTERCAYITKKEVA
jgi:hypothetical protein